MFIDGHKCKGAGNRLLPFIGVHFLNLADILGYPAQ
jgi:hypothetical protein